MKPFKWIAAFMLMSAAVLTANVYTVTVGAGVGSGTLYQAVISANSHEGPDTIEFAIEAMDEPPYYLIPTYPIPPLTDNGTFINGYTQEGATPNTGGPYEPDNAVINLMFDGDYLNDSIPFAFTIESDSNEICGIMFANMGGDTLNAKGSILIDGGGYNHIWGCWFGLDTSGTKDMGNQQMALLLRGGAHHNTIGGTAPEERNVFAGNDSAHIVIMDKESDENMIVGNFIGTDISGVKAPDYVGSTGYGIVIEGERYIGGPSGTIIGGEDSTYANIISGNPSSGIYIGTWGSGTGGDKIIGNRIGVDIEGNALGNGESGVFLDHGTTSDSILNNWISYNGEHGVMVNDTNTNHNVIMNNTITDNGGDGVRLYGLVQECLVKQCEIARNGGNGIYVAGPASDRNVLSENATYKNEGLGIDLAPPGITENDGNDSDDDSNDNMNFPVVDSASTSHVYGRLSGNSRANARIEIFVADTTVEAYGEGMTFLGSGVTDATGKFVAYISPALVNIGDYITATATDVDGNTSEFMKKAAYVCCADVEEEPIEETPLSLKAGVEAERIHVSYTLPENTETYLAIYDASGSLVADLVSQKEKAGQHSLYWDASGLSSGVYFIRLYAGKQEASSKFVLVR